MTPELKQQLQAFLEWQQNHYLKPYDTPVNEQIEDYHFWLEGRKKVNQNY